VGAALGLSPDDVEAIVAHGPWPPRFERDPGNRASGEPAAIELGRRLFTDPRLSADRTRACMDCHRPERAFADGRPRSPGRDGQPLDRNAPGLLDVRLMPWLGWDGGADSLWSFVMRPLADPREIGADDTKLAALLREDTTLACLRRAAFGDPAPAPTAAAAGE
jgi:cytochrome c peroxidase